MASQTIVLGITGGIAAYKIPELIRQLTAADHRVITVVTDAATRFVTRTTLAAVSGEPVHQSLWDESADRAMGHIELAREADILVVAPATADILAKFAHGFADDLLSTIYAATDAPVLVAPAMNQQMFNHAPTQRNLAQLKAEGVHVVGPNSGDQACGEVGPGRMSDPEEIAAAIDRILQRPTEQIEAHQPILKGLKVLVTAGPTREALDPVRFLTNASSGRQGFALAAAAQAMGADVTLISGPVALETPEGVNRVDVVSTADMHDVVHQHVGACDVMFAVAAVADYKPRTAQDVKIKKSRDSNSGWSLDLEETVDIVESVTNLDQRPFLVGFAAETHDVLEHARAKRVRKKLDAIVVNDVSDQSIGFDSHENRVTFIHDEGEIEIPFAAKSVIAERILTEVNALLEQTSSRTTANGGAG